MKNSVFEDNISCPSPIVIYGKNGQVASALAQFLQKGAIVFASSEFDFSNIENIRNALSSIDAKAIINATAYTDVNKAEIEENEAYKANALIPQALAQYCLEKNIPFVHYSTDYVFSSKGEKPHKENDSTAPINAYGRSKLAGEEKIRLVGGKYLILRTSWVYDSSRKNFLTTMLKLGKERETLSIVADQFGAPTYAPHLAKATLQILQKMSSDNECKGGIYHLCNDGEISWHGFAEYIFKQAKDFGITLKIQDIKPITSEEFITPAKRPTNSRLDCTLAFEKFGVKMPDWKDGVNEAFKLIIRDENESRKNAS